LPIGPHVGTAPAARLTGEPRLEIGQPNVIRPSIGVGRCVVAAMVIGAIDQETANASGAHFAEGDLLWAGEGVHAPLKRDWAAKTIPLEIGLGRRSLQMIKLTETRLVTPYEAWVHPKEDR
jgi:hypothetical protein